MNLEPDRLLAAVDPRTLLLALAGTVAVTALAGYFYLFKGDLRELERLRVSAVTGQVQPGAPGFPLDQDRVAALEDRVATLRNRLYGTGAPPGQARMTARIIARLDAISARRGITLVGVKPGTQRRVMSFVESPYEISVSGAYFDLVDWLTEAERQLRPLVVKQFELVPGERTAGSRLSMRLRIAAYLPARGGP